MNAVARVWDQYDKNERRKFENATRFPIVSNNGVQKVTVEYFIYSSTPPALEKYKSSKVVKYWEISPNSTCTFHIDSTLHKDTNTLSSVLAAINLTSPQPHSYFTTTYDGLLSGASLGLSATLAILGAPPVICTGFVNSFGVSFDADGVHAIDFVEHKAAQIRDAGEVLMLPEQNIDKLHLHNSTNLKRAYDNGGVYTFEHFLKGMNPWYQRPFAIAVSSVAEALLIAQTYRINK